MAKEDELKRVELKVSVNCCEGCKRKVLKALSIKGVLRTEIHPTLPKLTVIGNVDVGILIKKLSKVGKSAELLSDESQKPQGEGTCCNEASEKKTEKPSKKKGQRRHDWIREVKPEKENSPNSIGSNESNNRGSGDDAGIGQESSKEAGDAGGSDAPEAAKSFYPTVATTQMQ
ncbi:Heavy-metal-associated domain [Musa troglodytarum]|uniref:Heavy-metal-associated domain n=1 Tax=Musa troglodytarum TaxID=320322 RepID=A0A9E7FQK9_9LILI|nr:Heavy-metal-associated domain [Musa troglodytarum]